MAGARGAATTAAAPPPGGRGRTFSTTLGTLSRLLGGHRTMT
jgi:hypothetical protein